MMETRFTPDELKDVKDPFVKKLSEKQYDVLIGELAFIPVKLKDKAAKEPDGDEDEVPSKKFSELDNATKHKLVKKFMETEEGKKSKDFEDAENAYEKKHEQMRAKLKESKKDGE